MLVLLQFMYNHPHKEQEKTMSVRELVLLGAAASLAATPVAAQSINSPVERASAQASDESELAGRIGPALIIVALAAAGMLFLLLTDDDDDAVSA
ncbi:hypothetical protein [Parafrankia sp. BMG5.11]|uniref:hypothetical protein n=1 Tax=Parafrankia sp. BMG5.11 TaxID=222540 RepID=UPI00103F2A65|nr:hypothetical protein [Parafrankia sp. BMG5.11]TCJ40819.1 hypothetical protein E0504_02535 [Parafrankia sp. BMG5.11]